MWHDTVFAETSGGLAPIERIPLEETDVTINLPVVKDHGGSGVTGALKNVAFGCYRNHREDPPHHPGCDRGLLRRRARTAELPGGLARERDLRRHRPGGARCHAEGRDSREAKRSAAGLPDKLRQCRHIETAAAKGLGVGDPARIDIVTVRV